MKLLTGALAAGLVFGAAAADAQVRREPAGSPYTQVSDFEGPYAAMPPEVAVPRPGPTLLPAPEVYTVLREAGFSALGSPHRQGPFYTIAVINRRGEDNHPTDEHMLKFRIDVRVITSRVQTREHHDADDAA